MEKKVITHDPNQCTGCMYCMIACSTFKEGATSLSRARLQIIRHEGHALTRINEEDELVFTFTGCRQCEDATCAIVCPTHALTKDESTGAVLHVREKCIGCLTCLSSCPFGSISFHSGRQEVFKCDLCEGDPMCVKFCPVEALKFLPAEEVPLARRAETAMKARAMIGAKTGEATGREGSL